MRAKELNPEECQEWVKDDYRSVFFHQCSKKPVVVRNDKKYCKIHDPEYIKAKNDKKYADWKAKNDKEWEIANYKNLASKYCKLMGYSIADLEKLIEEKAQLNNG